MARKQQERMKLALEELGWSVDLKARPSRRYIIMRPPATQGKWPQSARFYLGMSGACRYSSSGGPAVSMPADKTKVLLLGMVPE